MKMKLPKIEIIDIVTGVVHGEADSYAEALNILDDVRERNAQRVLDQTGDADAYRMAVNSGIDVYQMRMGC